MSFADLTLEQLNELRDDLIIINERHQKRLREIEGLIEQKRKAAAPSEEDTQEAEQSTQQA